jgi:hypothetical protein
VTVLELYGDFRRNPCNLCSDAFSGTDFFGCLEYAPCLFGGCLQELTGTDDSN